MFVGWRKLDTHETLPNPLLIFHPIIIPHDLPFQKKKHITFCYAD